MKKVLFALAIAGMFGFVACNNNNKAAEEAENTVEAIEATAEEVIDSTVTVEEIATEAVEEVATEVAE